MVAEVYLKKNVDNNISIKPWQEKNEIPVFLRDNYNFYEMTILGTPCILMEMKEEQPGLDTLQKHLRRIESLTDRQVVLFYKAITRYRRKSLIENRMSFLIEDGQMYLPFLGLDLKQTTESLEKEVTHFSTSAQIAYLFFLYHKDDVVNVTGYAEKMGLSIMSASRALNDLYHTNLITYETGGKTGRSKEYKRITDPDYFLKGRVLLKSPVKKIVYAKTIPLGLLISGLDALAQASMINPPGYPTRAIWEDSFNKQEIEIITNKDQIEDLQPAKIEIWNYDPELFSSNNHVDVLSLYASLKDVKEERIEQALEEVMRGESWYMG
jgi:hypothetical protein